MEPQEPDMNMYKELLMSGGEYGFGILSITFQIRSKWWKTRENVTRGDVVLLIEPKIK